MTTKRRPPTLARVATHRIIPLVLLCVPSIAAAQTPDAGMEPDPAPATAALERAETVRIVAVGDIMMGTAYPDSTYLDPRIVAGADVNALIGSELVRVLRSGDVVFGNLEGALFDEGGETKRCRNMDACYAFRSPEWYASLLADLGFNLVSLANNHSGDFLAAGRAATRAALDQHGIAYGGLRVGEEGYVGYGDADVEGTGIKSVEGLKRPPDDAGTWAALLDAWRDHLGRLARAFGAGDAEVAPRRESEDCRYCDLSPLCRRHELAAMGAIVIGST